ncbi:Uncharacterised protein [Amycolatopsis camponoti]|uniref:Uncharacterized protein n=1 Tax=Amycolatopsis camponoti TaxID=2606593 RepID=A0A6I8LT77_9PSEU|nr:Uncharacterised protein [Amycolatopsis camponoti]
MVVPARGGRAESEHLVLPGRLRAGEPGAGQRRRDLARAARRGRLGRPGRAGRRLRGRVPLATLRPRRAFGARGGAARAARAKRAEARGGTVERGRQDGPGPAAAGSQRERRRRPRAHGVLLRARLRAGAGGGRAGAAAGRGAADRRPRRDQRAVRHLDAGRPTALRPGRRRTVLRPGRLRVPPGHHRVAVRDGGGPRSGAEDRVQQARRRTGDRGVGAA